MSDEYQTRVSSTGSQRSAEKVRHLTPEQLNLSLPEDAGSDDEDVSWEEVQKRAVEAAENVEGSSEGCAVVDSTENIHTGAALETSSEKIHSVRTAILSAVSDGETVVDKVVVHSDGEKELCGSCRQLIHDFSEGEAAVRISSSIGETEHHDIEELLP
jgi:cytidine deaminase